MIAPEDAVARAAGVPPLDEWDIEPVTTPNGPLSRALETLVPDDVKAAWGLRPIEANDVEFPTEGVGAGVVFEYPEGRVEVFYQPFPFALLDAMNERDVYVGGSVSWEAWNGLGEAVTVENGWLTQVVVYTYVGTAVNIIVDIWPFEIGATVPFSTSDVQDLARRVAEALVG